MAFSKEKADDAVRFINELRHDKGRWQGAKFNLRDWQVEIVTKLFGRLNGDRKRQYRTCYLTIPRKNGKSELCAAIALFLLFADGEPGAEIYIAAGDIGQANIIFSKCEYMVRVEPVLMNHCNIVSSQKRIVRPETNSFLRAISAEAYTKFGFNAHGIIFDELHVQPNRELWDTLTTSTGAREQPLTLAITTAGYDRNSICWEIHEYARKVKEGIIDDPTFLPIIYEAEESEDWMDEAVWHKCNPALGDFRSLEEMRTLFKQAQDIPAYENKFRRLYLNQWTRQEVRYMPMRFWDACAGIKIDPESLIGRECYGGLDLATRDDIAAFSLVFPPQEEGGSFVVLPFFWVPEDDLRAKMNRMRAPLDMWIRAGLIEATPGNTIDFKFIYATISKAAELYDIREIAFDRWGAIQIYQQFEERGMVMIQFGQGFKSFSNPTKELLNLTLEGRIHHGGNPVLRWMADNMVVSNDPAGNVKPNKAKSSEKIDGMVATIMGLDRALRQENPYSQYGRKCEWCKGEGKYADGAECDGCGGTGTRGVVTF